MFDAFPFILAVAIGGIILAAMTYVFAVPVTIDLVNAIRQRRSVPEENEKSVPPVQRPRAELYEEISAWLYVAEVSVRSTVVPSKQRAFTRTLTEIDPCRSPISKRSNFKSLRGGGDAVVIKPTELSSSHSDRSTIPI